MVDVIVPAGNTGMEPGKTAFFQALHIPTKIAHSTIEIVNNVQVMMAGEHVGSSKVALLNMLNILPFMYGMWFRSLIMGTSLVLKFWTSMKMFSLIISWPVLRLLLPSHWH